MEKITEVHSFIDKISSQYFKLILVVGNSNSGKTKFLKELSNKYLFDYINVNKYLSEKLIDFPKGERCYYVIDYLEEILDRGNTDVLLLDNTEMLFSKHLGIDPLKSLKNISKYRKIIATWNGKIEAGYLTYAQVGHSDFVKYKECELECLYITLERGY